jgi:peptidoglycan/LPS O-acetylase OafA/YrhL
VHNYRNFSLDFIRGLSVLIIIFYHYNCATVLLISKKLTLFKYYHYAGTIGVSLFFILSGAALATSTQTNYSLVSFYKKRFKAIFPLFWATYIFIVFATSVIYHASPFVGRNRLTFILTIFGVDGLLSYRIPNYYLIGEWFLGCIIILYIIFPVTRFLFLKNRYLTLAGAFVLCIMLDRFCHFNMSLLRFPLFRIFEFIFGMYCVTLFQNDSPARNYIFLLISSAGIAVLVFFNNYLSLFVSNAVLGAFVFIFLSAFAKIFQHHIPKKPIDFLSKYSYPAFLVHHIILVRIVTSLKNSPILTHYNFIIFLTTLLFIYIFSYLFYSVVWGLLRNSILSK